MVDKVYQGLTPTITNGGLQPLQAALSTFMVEANNYGTAYEDAPFGPNQAFMNEMLKFTDPGTLTPLEFDPRTGLAKEPDIDRTITAGIGFISKGDDIYLLRRALDCGPDENRTELVFLGNRFDLAEGSFAYYGELIMAGTRASGGGGSDGSGNGYDYSLPTARQATARQEPSIQWAGTDSVFGNNPGGDVPPPAGGFTSVA
jgi:hypothetical protein